MTPITLDFSNMVKEQLGGSGVDPQRPRAQRRPPDADDYEILETPLKAIHELPHLAQPI